MKKSLIALAVAGVVSAPAFAATSNVDIYGVLNVSVERIDSDQPGVDKSNDVNSNASRIGFKGAEDLGGGLKAIWQVESGFSADQSGGSLASRNTFVGLSGGFGTVLAGRHDSPMKMLGRKVDNFGDSMADSRNLLGAIATNGKTAFDLRPNNVLAYVSPNFSGLSVVGAYVFDHGGTGGAVNGCISTIDCNENDAYSVTADYTNGPFMLGAGYERHNIAVTPTQTDARKLWRLVGGYTFGNAKLGALYEKGSSDTSLSPADRNAWGLFGNFAMGNITLKANYLKAGDYSGVNNSSGKQYTLGADYALSKRSTTYAYYAKVKNDTNAAFGLGLGAGDSNSVSAAGADPSVFGVGMKHSF